VDILRNEQTSLFEAIAAEAERSGSLYRDTIPCRDDLLGFLDSNGWFDMEHTYAGKDILIDPAVIIRLGLWLRAYKKSRPEKIALMLETYGPLYPRTCHRYHCFLKKKGCQDEDAALRLLDFLLAAIHKELDMYDDAGIRELMDQANRELHLVGMRLFAEFLNHPGEGKPLSEWNYKFHSRQLIKQDTCAYTLEQFSRMAYTVFNGESWKEHGLIGKAAGKRKYADLWLFTALHFVCALRKTDIIRLPAPALPYPPEEVRQRIQGGTYLPETARGVAEEMMFRMQMKPLYPHKTKRYRAVPELKLFIPESILEPLGIIMSLSLSFRLPDDPFVDTNAKLSDIRRFFGDAFAKEAENKRLHPRRANKAYLQGLEMAAADGPGKPKGYMLAALARSHKGGIGRLPEMTDIYLRDANFSGYSPEFILREMFERGIFGFIPALLLEMYEEKDYLSLGVAEQTKLIRAIGLDACQLEEITAVMMGSFHRASEIVHSLLREQCSDKRQLETTLQRIASGAAPAKQPECLCLRSAAGFPCAAPDRTGCMGCGYEIYTKSAVHLLTKEYVRLNRLRIDDDRPDSERLRLILEKGVLPAITEILSSIHILYPDAEMEPLLEIVERGVKDADSV